MDPLPIILGIIMLIVILGSIFTVKPHTAAIVERFGQFIEVRKAGLHFKIPFIDKIAARISLKAHELENIIIETKTEDDFFVKLEIAAMFQVFPINIREAFYVAENPYDQITASLVSVFSAEVVKMKLNDVFSLGEDIRMVVCDKASKETKEFGYEILAVRISGDIEWKKSNHHPYNIKKPQHLRFR